MSSTFYALPLESRGESFLLKTSNESREVSVLVDVGAKIKTKSKRTLAKTINHHVPSLKKIDRLILTHEDSDHCGGAPQFIYEWIGNGNSISEIWLPALWFPAAGVYYDELDIIFTIQDIVSLFKHEIKNELPKDNKDRAKSKKSKNLILSNKRPYSILNAQIEKNLRKNMKLIRFFQ